MGTITITYLWVSETQPSHREHNFPRSDDDVLRNLHESANCSTTSVLVHRHVELQSHKISTQVAANLKHTHTHTHTHTPTHTHTHTHVHTRAQGKFMITCTHWWLYIPTSQKALCHKHFSGSDASRRHFRFSARERLEARKWRYNKPVFTIMRSS